jgi:eukaryotic-like serine/threonine-protein kinase
MLPAPRVVTGGASGAGGADALGMDGMPSRFGKYTLIRKLATGGMAELFLAIQKSVAGFEKLLVIKRILPSMNQDRAFIEMLLHEARIAATLSHPNIVQIFDVGQQDNQFFIAMEHVHGEDLRSIVRQMKKKDVLEFPLEHALAIVLGMCAGLSYAHEKHELDGSALNIVHRDISPQNVVVTFTGDVKIVDFGIAKSDSRIGEQTKSGKLKGKVPYMSPEQARGDNIDARSDIFSTGVMLFELTTGKRLFKGTSEYETLRLICERDYPRPSDVRSDYPPDLEPIVMKALAKDANDRYQTAREMQADIEGFVRRHQIAVSHIALNQFMQGLFEDKLAMQKEALLQGKQLADIIEMQHAMTATDANDVDASGRHATTSQSMPAAARTVTDIAASPHGRKSGLALGLIAAVIALAAVGGGFGYLLFKKKSLDEASRVSANASSSPLAPVVKGSLSLESDPPGASIWINGDLRSEVTPATLGQLPTGVALDVKLTMDGFEQGRESVTLKADDPSKVKLELRKGSVIAELKISPEGATPTFVLDGKPVDGPRIESLASGVSHKLVVSAPGYIEQTVTFSGNAMETKRLEVALEKAPEPKHAATPRPGGNTAAPQPAGAGKINVGASGGWCNVSIDGAPRGATPVAGVELSAGSHRVTCTTAEGKTQSATVVVPADGTARYKFTL